MSYQGVTRTSIGDEYGCRSVYVVEANYNRFGTRRDNWRPSIAIDDSGNVAVAFNNRAAAYRAMVRGYQYLKRFFNSKWTRKDFRVTLYARVEG